MTPTTVTMSERLIDPTLTVAHIFHPFLRLSEFPFPLYC